MNDYDGLSGIGLEMRRDLHYLHICANICIHSSTKTFPCRKLTMNINNATSDTMNIAFAGEMCQSYDKRNDRYCFLPPVNPLARQQA